MKKLRTGIYLFVILFISCISYAAGSDQAVQTAGLFNSSSSNVEKVHTIDLPAPESNIYHRLTNFEDKEFSFHARFKKKYKTKFLIQHLNFSHYIKKPDRQHLLQHIDMLQELHSAISANNWLIRPAYYNFLFRLSPF
jgi:hypothetical protein